MSELHSHSDPHTPHSVTGDARRRPDTKDVSAGPGDAGAQDEPRRIAAGPEREAKNARATTFAVWVIVIGLAITAAIYLFS